MSAYVVYEGLQDLRDQMAIAAMNGLFSVATEKVLLELDLGVMRSIAKVSYCMADVMLEARQNSQKDQGEGT